MSKKVKIIGCVAVLVTGLTGSAQDLNENDVLAESAAGSQVAFQKFTGYNGQRMEKLKEVF